MTDTARAEADTITPDEAHRLLDGTTPGPWSDVRVGRMGDGSACSHEEQWCNTDGEAVAIFTNDGSLGGQADARLARAAPDLARTVIAQREEIERLRAEAARLTRELNALPSDLAEAKRVGGEAFVAIADSCGCQEWQHLSDIVSAAHAMRVSHDNWHRDCVAAVTARDELRAILTGRTTPPTNEEIEAHTKTGGRWRTDRVDAQEGIMARHHRDGSSPFSRQATRWWAIDAQRKPCPWPEVSP